MTSKESLYENIVGNMKYYVNERSRIQQNIHRTSLKGNEVLNCTIYKFDHLTQKDSRTKSIIHINTLAQIFYESFSGKQVDQLSSIPILFLFEKSVVEGVKLPGAYILDLTNDSFLLLKDVDIEKLKLTLRVTKPVIAVGYVLNEELEETNFPERILEESRELSNSLIEMLDLHGDLSSYVETSFALEDMDFPLLLIQWIEKK